MSGLKRSWKARLTAVFTVAAAAAVVTGGVAFAAQPDNPSNAARAATTSYFARVGDNGTQAVLVAGQGVASVSRNDSNEYFVTFNNPIDKCSWTASINPFFGGPPGGWGPILVGLNWDNTVVPPENQTPDPHVLRVIVTAGDGSAVLMGDQPSAVALQTFSVTATCPVK